MGKPKAPRYSQTAELVRIALKQGMTQQDIGKLCRGAGQSTVSKWASGKLLSDRQTLKALLDRFGHLLERKPFRLYERMAGDTSPRFLKVEGKTILRERFAVDGGSISVVRLTVQALAPQSFVLMLEATKHPARSSANLTRKTDYTHRHVAWYLLQPELKGMSMDALLERVDMCSREGLKFSEPNGQLSRGLMPRFSALVREALLNHGYAPKDIEVLGTSAYDEDIPTQSPSQD